MNYQKSALLPPSRLDNAIAGRISSGCWFVAAWGTAIFQITLLAQTWRLDQRALPAACVASAWVLGSVAGLRVLYALRRATFPAFPRLWGAALLACALGWWLGIAPRLSPTPPTGQGALPESVLILGATAFLMGTLSTCWLATRRAWPAIGEQVLLARGLIGLTLGLFISWTLPAQAGPIGLLFLLPLLALDLLPASSSPFPTRGGRADAMLERSSGDPAAWLPLRLSRRGQGRWWWLSYLRRRRYILSSFLAVSLTVLSGSIWYSVPTPFAAHLTQTHQVETLAWLVAGQLGALAVGWYTFGRSRGVVGAADRLVPPGMLQRCWNIARLSLFSMAAGLVFLGLPFLQAPWWLASSLALYTLGGFAWAILLPRLRPRIATQAYSLRHLLVSSGTAPTGGQMAFERALEDRAMLSLASLEGILTAAAAPLAGVLIDRSTFDDTLVLVGLSLALALALVLLAISLARRRERGRAPAIAWAAEAAGS